MMLQKPVGRMSSRTKALPVEQYSAMAPPVEVRYRPLVTLTDLWSAVSNAFQQAAQVISPTYEHFYRINENVICLRFAGTALVAGLTPALAHLAVAPHPTPALTVSLWDSATTGVPLPPLPTTMQQPLPADQQWGSYGHSERFHAFFQTADQIFTMLDQQDREAFYWVQDASRLPLAEGSAPLLTLLHWWLGQQGRQIVHGAAVGTAAGGALLVGKSGSGKSTTALRCLQAGFHYLGDDYCLVAATPQPTVYSLYSSGKVHFADLGQFPRFQLAQSKRRYTDADKALYFFAEPFAAQLAPNLPIKALLLPTLSQERKSTVSLVSPATALLSMGPSTVFQLVGEKSQTLHHLAQLARQLPCYRLALGLDRAQIPPLIADLLAKLP